jgi:Xaa-Pro aminopeptidase
MSLWYASLLSSLKGRADALSRKAPMGRSLVDVSLLSVEERGWVDGYHKEVWEKLSPLLEGDARAKAWLHRECAPL